MKKMLLLMVLIMTTLSFGAYNVGAVCDDISWTDNDGLATSIHEQTAAGKAVMIFWGDTG